MNGNSEWQAMNAGMLATMEAGRASVYAKKGTVLRWT